MLINDVIVNALRSIGFDSRCCRGYGRHPDGMTVSTFSRGSYPVCIGDCVEMCTPSALMLSVTYPRFTAQDAEVRRPKILSRSPSQHRMLNKGGIGFYLGLLHCAGFRRKEA